MSAQNIEFNDLGKPKLSAIQKLALCSQQLPLKTMTQDTVLSRAAGKTGLNDFGSEDFRERLQILLDEYNEDEELTNLGRKQLLGDLTRYAANRLLIQEQLKRHPSACSRGLKKPLIVAGLPRSGTTHLVNLLASDQRFASLPLWLSQEPFHVPGQEYTSLPLKLFAKSMASLLASEHHDNADPRYLRSSLRWSAMQLMAPSIAAMHPMNPDHVHEELELMAPDFASYNFEWTSVVPRYRDHYLQTDQLPHYEYMKNVLKLLQLNETKPKSWVLKCPQHMEQLPVLKQAFPDATLVITHRDPVAVIQSAATMMTYPQRMLRKNVEPRKVIDYWTDRIEKLLRSCVQDRNTWDSSQSMDVLFHEFMEGDMDTVSKIYDLAGVELTAIARKQMADFIKDHPRGKHGRVIYNLKENFGVSAEEIRERFEFYYREYPVKIEAN